MNIFIQINSGVFYIWNEIYKKNELFNWRFPFFNNDAKNVINEIYLTNVTKKYLLY